MKRKLLAVVLSALMALSLVACGSKENNEEVANTTTIVEETKAKEVEEDPIDELIEDAGEKVVEEVTEALAADTRIKKVDDIPEDVWNACVAKAEEIIEEINDYEYKLVRADVIGYTEKWTDDLNANVLVLIYEFNTGAGKVKYADIQFPKINTGTIEEITDIWERNLHYTGSLERHDESAYNEELTIIFDSKVFE